MPFFEEVVMDNGSIEELFYNLNTRKDVASLLGISDRSLRYFLFHRRPENMYHAFRIPKKDGTTREILAPDRELREIQRKLANVLEAIYMRRSRVCAYGFIRGKNNVENAKKHIKKHLVFNIDLKDFFSQIHFGRIKGMLVNKPYCIKNEAAVTIAQIACCNGLLPQGAPSSPIISNLILIPLDNALMRLAKETQCIYTRYADDITFSTNKSAFDKSIVYVDNGRVQIGAKLTAILEKHSFVVNNQKITLRAHVHRQEVTGITVNKFPNLRRSYIKQLRAIIHSCEKFGVVAAARFFVKKGLCKNANICRIVDIPDSENEVIEWFKLVLVGKVHYIKQVKGANSFTYLSFADKINKIFGDDIFNVAELHRFSNIVVNSTFIIESYMDDEEYVQGSAFYLNDIGLITSYHVTKNGGFYKVYNVNNYHVKHLGLIGENLRVKSYDEQIDYAIYEPPFDIDHALTFECGDSRQINIGDPVTIIGYPNHIKGNSPYIQSCYITSKKELFDCLFFTVSGRIVHGASGGIVLNSKNEAIGIIKGGVVSISSDSECENQGFVPLHLVLEHMHRS